MKDKCNANLISKTFGSGSLNDSSLTDIVSDVKNGKRSEESKCNIEFNEKNLLITFTRKDEGFESSSELEEKIIKDHVFKCADSSEDTSSGGGSSESDSDNNNKSQSSLSSVSTRDSPSDHVDHVDRLDVYSISDVLLCQVDGKSNVIFVIRRAGSLEALLFDCVTSDSASEIQQTFNKLRKRSKVDRCRRRNDGVNGGSKSLGVQSGKKLQANEISDGQKFSNDSKIRWNLVEHTDKNGVTHLEVESSSNTTLVEEAGNGSKSLITFKSPPSETKVNKSKFAVELESILSSKLNKKRTDPAIKPKLECLTSKNNPRLMPTASESLSLRQRTPNKLLRKLDEFEQKAQRAWTKAEEEENRKVWSSASHSVIGISALPRGPLLENVNQSSTASPSESEDTKAKPKETKSKDRKQILIPTKTGREPPKKFYPKESPLIFHSRLLPLGVTQQLQPNSIPLYPVPINSTFWNRYGHDLSHLEFGQSIWRQNLVVGNPGGASSDPRRGGRSRSREPCRRKLVQNKVPSKKPTDPVTNVQEVSSLSNFLKDFSESLLSKMSKRTDGSNAALSSQDPAIQLKSNLKKECKPVDKSQVLGKSCSGISDSKKVHFNKFATVQMMQH